MSACVYSVFIDDVHVKAFKNRDDAYSCAFGIQIWFSKHGIDDAHVHVEEDF